MHNPTNKEKNRLVEGRIGKIALAIALTMMSVTAFAQQGDPLFNPGNLVVVVEGCGVHGGTCTTVPNGTGTGADNSSSGGYGDNQAAPLTLFQYAPTGTASAAFVNSFVLPQTGSLGNLPVSGEYGSSSEGGLQLSGLGQYLTLMGYGINAGTFDVAYYACSPLGDCPTAGDPYGAAPSGALAQSGSLTGQSYTPMARVLALIDAYGNVNSSTALYNVFNTNNPRSVYTADGETAAYVSGQGSGCDATGGVFLTPLGTTNTAPTPIIGADAVATTSCNAASGLNYIYQDTRDVQIYYNPLTLSSTLYISIDSTEGKSDNRSLIGTLGTPPATSLYTPTNPPTGDTGGPNLVSGFGNTGGTGKVTLTTGANSNGNNLNNNSADNKINLSPVNYFFASPSVLYVADSGNPKNDSNGDTNSTGTTNIGDGGLQKWINSQANGSGTWSLAYTLWKGLTPGTATGNQPWNGGVVNNGSGSGTPGLYSVIGTVSGTAVQLYATNYTLNDLDPTYLYGITDNLSYTTASQVSGEVFALLDTAPADSNFKGVSFAPTIPTGAVEITSSPSGLVFTSAGTGCAPGTYTTPQMLVWTPGKSCTLSVATPQIGAPGNTLGVQYAFAQWEDGTTSTTHTVTAPPSTATYTATFNTESTVTTTGLLYSRVSKTFNGTLTLENNTASAVTGPVYVELQNLPAGVVLTGADATTEQGYPAVLVLPSGQSFNPGQSASAPISFSDPTNESITFTPVTYVPAN